jgi:hypothetical protein
MSEIKEVKPQGMMARQEETEEVDQGTGLLSGFIDDPEDRKALGRIITDALTGFSTMFGSTARQLGALEEEQRIYDQRQELAAQSAAQELDVMDRENKKNAEDLKKIKARNQENKKNGFLLLSQPMFKRQLDDYRAKTGVDIDIKDPNFLTNIGRAYGDLAKRIGKDSALATFAKKIYVAKQDPNIKLFENYFVDSVTKSVDEQTQEALKLKKPKSLLQGVARSLDPATPFKEMVDRQRAKATPKVTETVVPETGEVFKTLSDVEKIRMTKEQQDKLAASKGLAITYDSEFSTEPRITDRGSKDPSDLNFFDKAVELLPFILDGGYGSNDGDKVFKDLMGILENIAPKEKTPTGQIEFERRVDQIKNEFSRLDRFEKQARIQQLAQGVPRKTGSGETGGKGKEDKPVVNNLSTLSSALDTKLRSVSGDAGSYLLRSHESDPNIQQVDKNTYNIIVKKDTDQYPAGTVLSVKLEFGDAIEITDTGQKTEVLPEKLGTGRLAERKQRERKSSLAPKPKEEFVQPRKNRRNRR